MCLHKFVKLVRSCVHVRTFYIEQMFVLVRMLFHNHVDTHMGVGRGGKGALAPPWILKLLATKGCFFNFEGWKPNFTTFAPPGKNPSDAHGHTTNETFRKGYAMNIYQIWNVASTKEWDFTAQMLWWFCAVAHLEGTLVTREYARFDNNDSERKSQVRLRSQEKIKIF